MMVSSVRLLSLLAVLGAAIIVPGTASAEISRYCKGSLIVELKNGVDKNGKAYSPHGSGAAVFFTGKGNCKNKRHANECREQARSLISICGGALWGYRWSKKIPSECSSAKGSSRAYGAIESWGPKNTPLLARGKLTGDVKRSVEYVACCQLQPHARQLKFLVNLKTDGDKGCPYTQTLEQNYSAQCKKLREQGLCG